jgi:hypothetical protein
MAANPTQKQNWFHANQLTQSYGEPGKYVGARTIAASAGTVDVTGEGYGAILIGDATNLVITTSNGTVVPTAQFNLKTIYDIGIKKITQGATGNCTIFKRQQ